MAVPKSMNLAMFHLPPLVSSEWSLHLQRPFISSQCQHEADKAGPFITDGLYRPVLFGA
jgi:hypothetical protein